MKPFAPLIRYRCTKPEHQHSAKSLSDTMTIHERAWAFCAYDARETDHLWALENPDAPVLTIATEPADLQALG